MPRFVVHLCCSPGTAEMTAEIVALIAQALPDAEIVLLEDEGTLITTLADKRLSSFKVTRRQVTLYQPCRGRVRRDPVFVRIAEELEKSVVGDEDVLLYLSSDTVLLKADSLGVFGRSSCLFWGVSSTSGEYVSCIFALKGKLASKIVREWRNSHFCVSKEENMTAWIKRSCSPGELDVKPVGTHENGVRRWARMNSVSWPIPEELAAFRTVSFFPSFGPVRQKAVAESMRRIKFFL